MSRAFTGAFHDYVRGVFAEHSAHAQALRAMRTRWLQRLGQRSTSSGAQHREHRWDRGNGSTR